MSDGGKGSAPRQKRDDDAFRANWERIFGNKRSHEAAFAVLQTKPEDSALGKLLMKEPEHCQNKGKCAEPFCSCEEKKDE